MALPAAGDRRLNDVGAKVIKGLSKLMKDAGDIKPSLLHGDLWSGNVGQVGEEPCIYDPACYYGHHEAEFGMSWCAGRTRGRAAWRTLLWRAAQYTFECLLL